MKQLPETIFNDFENPQIIWELYGELLDGYEDQTFSAENVAYLINLNKKTVNRALHRLIQFKAVEQAKCDIWGVKQYRLNPQFTS
jgi:predicted transcriptional regulator